MEWRRLALKNGWRNARRYTGYLASASLAVMVFFIFALFLHNPFVTDGQMSSNVRFIIDGFRYVVGIFAVVFIVFFHSSMMRYRNREFGLFLTLGMTPAQVGRMIFLEGLMLGAGALVIGIALGLLFGKMFLLAMGNILSVSEPIPYALPSVVFTSTLLMFGAVFVLESLYLAIRMSLRSPKALLLGARTRQKAPQASWWRVLLSLVCLSIAYYLAVFKSTALQVTLFPIFFLTLIGTYYLFTQTLVGALTALRKRALSGKGLLVVARLTHRIGDHARMLTLVAILTAIVLTGMGGVTGTQSINKLNTERVRPVTLNVTYQDSQAAQLDAKPDVIRQILRDHDLDASQELQASLVLIQMQAADGSGKPNPTWAMRQTDYDKWTQRNLEAHPALREYYNLPSPAQPGEPRFLVSYPVVLQEPLYPNGDAVVRSGSREWKMQIDGQYDARPFNLMNSMTDFVIVLADSDFEQVQQSAAPESRWTTAGWMTPDYQDTRAAAAAVLDLAAADSKSGRAIVTDAVSMFDQAHQMLEVMLFAGLFVSTLFFLASCSAIYFRLFTQQEEDARQFASLKRLGFERGEAGWVLTLELLLLFFLPFVVAMLHATVAMKDLMNLLSVEGSIWGSYFLVVGISILCFFAYFLAARMRYLRQVWR